MQNAVGNLVSHLDVVQLTSGQGDAAWFLLRKFHITSSVSAIFTAQFIKTLSDPFSVDGLQRIATVIGYKLSNQDPVTFDNDQLTALLKHKKKRELVVLLQQLNLVTTGNKPELIERLIANRWHPDQRYMDPEAERKRLRQLMHDAWFMKPVQTRAMNTGSLNENRISAWLMHWLEKESHSKFSVCGIRKYGLVSHKEKPWLATSVDSMLALYSTEDSKTELVIGEYKTRSSASTIDKYRSIATSAGTFTALNLDSGSADFESAVERFKLLVPERNYRQQLLHHVSTLNVAKVLYVEATLSEIQYAVLIHFGDGIIESYHKSIVKEMYSILGAFHEVMLVTFFV